MPKRSLLFLFLFGFFAFSNSIQAQNSSVDAVISDLYQSISFDKTQAPDFATFVSLFSDNAQLISVRDTTAHRLTPDNYKKIMDQQRISGKIIAFEETELHRTTDQFGNIMQVFSTYQTQLELPNKTNSARGINSIQLMKEGGQWKIVSIIWYEENAAHPIPKKYLPPEEE